MGWLLMGAAACGRLTRNESADEPSVENGAGQGNDGGPGASGSDVVAGAGGRGGDGCNTPRDLAEYCSRHACGKPDDVDECPHSVGRECTLQGPETTLCGDLERCDTVELTYLCDAPDACPAFDSPEAIHLQLCGDGDTVERFVSTCDGFVFRHHSGTTVSEWSFDADGELVGVVVTGDTVAACPYFDFLYSKVAVYGRPCAATGGGEDQCGAGGAGGAAH